MALGHPLGGCEVAQPPLRRCPAAVVIEMTPGRCGHRRQARSLGGREVAEPDLREPAIDEPLAAGQREPMHTDGGRPPPSQTHSDDARPPRD
jgi:hypothetical protein